MPHLLPSPSSKIAFFNAILPKSGKVRARIAVPGKRFIGSELLPIEEVISRIDDGLKVTASFATFEGWDHKKNKPGECDEHVAEETSRGIDLDGLASISHVEALQRAFPGAWVIWSNGITLAYRACGPWAQDCLLMARVGQEAARLTGLKYDSSCNIRKDGTPALHRGHLFRIGGVAEKRNGVTEYFGPIDAAATLVTDSVALPEWVAPQQQVKNRQRQVRAAAVLDYQIEAKTGSEAHKHAKCASVMSDRVSGFSMMETANRNRTTLAHVERIWREPQKFFFNPGHNEYIGTTRCGMRISGPTRRIQGPLHRYNDLWHGFADVYAIYKFSKEDMKENCITHHHLKGPIETYRKNFGIKTDEELQIAMNKEIDHHAETFPENLNGEARPENAVSPESVELVRKAIQTLGRREFTGAIIEACMGYKLSRDQITRALHVLPEISDNGQKGRAHLWIWEGGLTDSELEASLTVNIPSSPRIGIVERGEGRSFDPYSLPLPAHLVQKAGATPPPWGTPENLQKEIAEMLDEVCRAVVTGPGGSGKTDLIDQMQSVATGRVIVCAPQNSIVQNSRLEDMETIHTALGIRCDVELNQTVSYAGWKAKKRRIKAQWVIVDESSMVSSELMWAILKRTKEWGAKVIFVGDHRQLQPIGNSAEKSYPFRDLMAWAGKCKKMITLTGNHRVQKGSEGLAQAIQDIDAGIAPKNGPGFRVLRLKEEDAPRLNTIAAKYLAGLRKKNPAWRAVSVLKGEEWGAQNIGNLYSGNGNEIAVGDEIVVARTDRKHGVFKGQRGKVTKIVDRRHRNRWGDESRWTAYECALKAPKKDGKKPSQLCFMNLGGEVERAVKVELKRDDIIRGTCQNTHAVQGEQDGYWLVVLENSRITTKEMFYVAVSRGMKNVIVLTVEGTIYKALSTSAPYKPAFWAM